MEAVCTQTAFFLWKLPAEHAVYKNLKYLSIITLYYGIE
jgi:hypothetical protein